MEKNDTYLKEIVLAAIKRNTIKPFNFKYTCFYDVNTSINDEQIRTLTCVNPCSESSWNFSLDMEGEEAYICSTIITDLLWTILTTRRILSREGLLFYSHSCNGFKIADYADFKGYAKQEYTKGCIVFKNDNIIPVFIETGNASMVMISGTRILLK